MKRILQAVALLFFLSATLTQDDEQVLADDIPIAHTPAGYWKTMPGSVLANCTEPLSEDAIDMRGMWIIVELVSGPANSERSIGNLQRIEQCGNRIVITAGGVTHDMRADGSYENGVNDIGEPSTNGRPISVAASFENGVHILRPKGVPITVERELQGDSLIWRYGPIITFRLERTRE
ncbi:MAG TPA: hypothetical protein QGF41_07730 [Gammaproteobacteria bacterium]|nr:hypothetical protein [Gammaproteobacteria bacterium]